MTSRVIGREHEIAEASSFLEDVSLGRAGLLISGEPGIGKTTLWSAIVERSVERGFIVLVARPAQAEAELAFGVLIDLFATVDADELDELPPAQRAPLEAALRRREGASSVDPAGVALATTETLHTLAAATPVLVAVDDLQWADTPSLRALTFAFRRLADVPVGLVATLRAGFSAELTELAGRDGSALERLELRGLGNRHLAQLVFERTGRTLTPPQLARLADLSKGNPYYALELTATGDPDLPVPESLSGALRTRLSALSSAARAVGLTAAVLGRFDESLHTGVHRRGLDDLRASGVVAVHSGVPAFAHPLLASTLLEMHTTAERRAVHRSLAHALADPDERAVHLGRGTEEEDEAVAAELELAADRLDARGAPETAAILLERAAALTPGGDEATRTARLIKAADLYQAAGESADHVLPLLERLLATLPAGPDRARVLLRLGWLGAQMDTITASEVVDFQERALAEAGGAPDVVSAAHAVLARLLGNGGDYRAAHRHAQLAVDAEVSVPSNLMFPSPLGELATARFFAGEGLDEQLFEQGIELEPRIGRVGEPYQSPRLQLALALLYTGQLARARAVLHNLLQLSVELGRVRSRAGCVLHLIELETRAGNLDEAEEHAAEFVDLDRQLRGDLAGEWYPSGLVAMHLGRVDDARRILEEGIAYSRSVESTNWLAHQLWALGHLELALGNLAEARELLVPVPAMMRETGLGEWSAHPVHPDAIEVLVALGELEQAAGLTAELADYGRRLDRPWGLAAAARSEALIASARGDAEEALVAADQALAEHDRLEWPFERARTLLVTGSILRRLGRRRDAGAMLAEARSVFETLRSPLWRTRAAAEEARVGGRRGSGDELTPTEARVASLARQGLRNAEIAASLHVTPKTVEATLSRVYRKLGVRSRTELAHRAAAAE